MIALIDADVLCYRIGFACEKTLYVVKDDDLDMEFEVRSKKEALELGDDISTKVDAMPESFAEELLVGTIKYITKEVKASSFRLFLTDSKSNFRNEVAKHVPYKGNRSGKKPVHFDFLRNYMIDKLNAEEIVGQEADDAMGIAQTKDTVICSIDKDLWQVPGKHYDIVTGKKVVAKDPGKIVLNGNELIGVGFKWFCAQMLLGDQVDNIKGIRGIGPKKAYTYLNDRITVRTMWRRVRALYKMHKCIDRLEENALLLWMRREEDQHPYSWIKENIYDKR
jgi:5'-3' exonuclease